MTTPYTYCITHIPTGKRYYGARYAKGCSPADLWVKYFTSSETVKRLIDSYGKDSFAIEIRKVFKSAKECTKWERKVLIRLGVPRNKNWLNKYSGISLTAEEMSEAILNKYGHDHQSKIPEVKEAKRLKSMEKYGTEYTIQAKEVKEKAKRTMLERYGYENAAQVPEFKERISKAISMAHQSKPQVPCPKCGYSCKSESNMRRYHFDNCKHYDILRLHNEGKGPKQISETVSLDRHSVAKYLRFFDIKPNLCRSVNENALNMKRVRYDGVEFRSVLSLSRYLNVSTKVVNRMIEQQEIEVCSNLDNFKNL